MTTVLLYRPDEKLVGGQRQFKEAFKNAVCRMWFNTSMVRNTDLINEKYPWRFVTRDVISLCR
jgi:hypothetical protein